MTRRAERTVLHAAMVAIAFASIPHRVAAQLDDARDALHTGKYKEGIAPLGRVAQIDTEWLPAQRELVRALATVGRYDEAEATGRRGVAATNGARVATALGDVLLARGKRAAAESAFVRAVAEHADDSLTAAVNLAILHYDRGERDRAMKEFDHFIDVYNAHGTLTSEELVAVATAVEYLGANDPQLLKDALKAFDRAIATDGDNLDARIRLGELFLAKYQSAEAQSTFEQVLSVNESEPRGLLGAAARLSFDGLSGADSLVQRALQVNPEYVDARVFRADNYIGLEDYDSAQRELDRALRTNPASERALAVAGAVRYLKHDTAGFEAVRRQALSLDPHDGEFYATVAELTANVRLYAQAADLARQGVAADPKNWRAWGVLGMNQLRLGQIEDGRKSLDTAFKGDPYNLWIKNTLDLLDTYKNYDIVTTDHFQFMIEKDEAPLLSIYMKDLGERAYATFAARYGYTPPPPIRIEVYRSHADFSVRTVGLAGLGALGVSFGTTLAFDSPASKDEGPFNWGSTMWHELAHTFTLGITDHRVPRWLSEGLSVYEEHHAMPGWGFNVSPQFLEAFKEGKLVPVSRMNDGFMHPAYAEQVQFSYYEASLVCELIARDWGEPALVKMLHGYKDGLTTEEVFQRVLSLDVKEFDKRFDSYLRQRFARPLAAITSDTAAASALASLSGDEVVAKARADSGDLRVQLIAGAALATQGRAADALVALNRAASLFPDYGGEGSPYPLIATLLEEKHDTAGAATVLTKFTLLTEANYAAWTELAKLREALGDFKGAAEAIDRALYVNPFDIAVHQHLADLYHRAADYQHVVRERQAVVALGPVDRTEALYQLALAYRDVGDAAHARTAVLRALEEAPNYERAQTLLLQLHDERLKQNP